jgi:vacuolar-type H+-ATPase catalytic subunit A/Vma1
MKKMREEKKKVEADQRYKRANAALDKKLAFQKEMKSILNAEQYEKFQKMSKARKRGMKQRMAKRKKMAHLKKKKKERKHKDEDN